MNADEFVRTGIHRIREFEKANRGCRCKGIQLDIHDIDDSVYTRNIEVVIEDGDILRRVTVGQSFVRGEGDLYLVVRR